MTLRFCFGMWCWRSASSLKGEAGIQGSVNEQASYIGLACNATGPVHATALHTRDQHEAVTALFEQRSARFTGN